MNIVKKIINERKASLIKNLGDGKDPEIIIPGFGTMTLSLAYKKVATLSERMAKDARNQNVSNLRHVLDAGVLTTIIDTIEKVEAELSSPQMKRKITMLRKK